MPVGLELYRDNGVVLLNVTTYVGMFEGSFNTNGAASGSFINSAMIGRTLLTFTEDTGGNGNYRGPNVTLNSSNGQISWNYTMVAAGTSTPGIPNDTIHYGGY